jgi:hypothetical protein
MNKTIEWRLTENNDTGSLRTGEEKLVVGDRIQIEGEPSERHVTYVMGSDAKGWHATFANQGAVPVGQVRWRSVERASLSESQSSQRAVYEPPDLSKKRLKELASMLMPGQAWAILTILASLLVGAFSLGMWVAKQTTTPASHHSARWLMIEGIEAAQHQVARITVSVNGEEYISYPSGHVWAEIEPSMPKEKYPLPYDADTYSLHFGAFLSGHGPTDTVTARCRETDVIAASALPATSHRCELFPSTGSYWGGKSIGTVTYSVFGG